MARMLRTPLVSANLRILFSVANRFFRCVDWKLEARGGIPLPFSLPLSLSHSPCLPLSLSPLPLSLSSPSPSLPLPPSLARSLAISPPIPVCEKRASTRSPWLQEGGILVKGTTGFRPRGTPSFAVFDPGPRCSGFQGVLQETGCCH